MSKHNYKVHPAAELFPLMSAEEFKGLKEDIAENGQREDIVVWKGQLLDGRNRLRACEELNREPHIGELDEDSDPWAYVISHNLHRRHLSTTQRAKVASKLADLKHGGDRKSEEIKGSLGPLILEQAAKQLNVSRKSVVRARQVQELGSDAVNKALERDELPVTLAAEFVKVVPDKKDQDKILKQGAKAVREKVSGKLTQAKPAKKNAKVDDAADYIKKERAEFAKLWKKYSDPDAFWRDMDDHHTCWFEYTEEYRASLRIWTFIWGVVHGVDLNPQDWWPSDWRPKAERRSW